MINCAIIGLGRVASEFEKDTKREKPASHAGAIAEHSECRIVAGCDIDKEKCESFGDYWSCDNLYQDYEVMLSVQNIDILHIATPPDTHKQMVVYAVEAGIPVIVLEKPVSDNIEEAQFLREFIKGKKTKIIVNHERRYSLPYLRVKEVIKSKTYGSLLAIQAKLYIGRTQKLPSMLYNDGTHMVDLIHFLTDSRMNIETCFTSDDNNFIFACGYSGKVPVVFEAARNRDYLVFELDLTFESGRIVVGNGFYHEYQSKESPYYEQFRSLIENDYSFEKTEYFKRMFDDAVKCFNKNDKLPVSSLSDGVDTLEVIEDILQYLNKE
ncbi:MAG: Gfo/Idh/MocA family oxidoreductase [Spirochaetales bacterium]|nr:Gfo/Idh/MocA family oxidoreductase [Spirochaetales bacterium]